MCLGCLGLVGGGRVGAVVCVCPFGQVGSFVCFMWFLMLLSSVNMCYRGVIVFGFLIEEEHGSS